MDRTSIARAGAVVCPDPRAGFALVLALTGAVGCVGGMEQEVGINEEALSAHDCPADTPDALAPAADQRLDALYVGDGVQIYDCRASGAGYAWTFRAPEADLLGHCGHVAGTHYVGPTWEANDGSTVVAARAAGVTVDPSSIPWLLLNAVSHAGEGRFTRVTSIQRLNTVGGLAPVDGCNADTVGAEARVPYTADYFFYRTGHGNPAHNPQCR